MGLPLTEKKFAKFFFYFLSLFLDTPDRVYSLRLIFGIAILYFLTSDQNNGLHPSIENVSTVSFLQTFVRVFV